MISIVGLEMSGGYLYCITKTATPHVPQVFEVFIVRFLTTCTPPVNKHFGVYLMRS